jgi:bifunctional UDP-N-acetylglucosamine pyrophosphorylase/glucosamine-1-phosphate N-acetyltransferase
VITYPVPAGALGLGRSRQVTKEGWVAKREAEKQMKEAAAKPPDAPPGKARPPARRAG